MAIIEFARLKIVFAPGQAFEVSKTSKAFTP
jgi:hypothetical protein